MKRLLVSLLLSLCILPSHAQQLPSEITSHWSTDRISLDYSCTLQGDVPVELKGTLLLQDNCFFVKGNGVEIYCDGETRWTLDREAEEVYIEKADSLEEILKYYGSISKLNISNVRYGQKSEDLSAFRFSASALGSSWVVTDLR